MLQDILQTFAIETGYDTVNQLQTCLGYINRAAKDLHDSLEADSLMRETVLQVSTNLQVTLPSFIGDIRALREYGGYSTFPLNEIGMPRFTSDTWKYKWRNWTLKGKQPLATSILNASILTLTTNTVETIPAQVVITGRTTNSKRIAETVIVNALMVQTLNSFEAIDSITSSTLGRTYNITIQDIAGNVLAILYNTDSKTQYILVDVARYNWSAQTGDGVTTLVEVLYKTKFTKFYNLTDEFPADGYDDGIAYKAVELWYHGQEGKEQDALMFRAKALEVINNTTANAEKGELRKLAFAETPTYQAFRQLRNGFGWRRTGRFGRYGGIY
jgi:hypothetical protein